jgi:Histidine kinase-, DNA gyrase B-, and HSP90-like ATPase
LSDAEKILKQTIGPGIRLLIRAEADLPSAWVDSNQLELAILNLALNARDAMAGGGRLQITCDSRRAPARDAPTDLAEGDYVVVAVSDTGSGMAEATLARAFEPFFTTKAAGRGSGLGLSMVQGFAAQSAGTGGSPAPSVKARPSSYGCRAPKAEQRRAFPSNRAASFHGRAGRASSFATMTATCAHLSGSSCVTLVTWCGKRTIPAWP